jgi:hypothetical protein
VPRGFLAGVPATVSEIQVKSSSSIWHARKYAIVLERWARSRGKEWRGGGRLELTANDGYLDQQWRHGGLWHEQPGSVLARVLERESVREGGVYMGAMAWQRG